MPYDHRGDWDNYWRGAGGLPVFSQFAKHSRRLEADWSAFFSRVLADSGRARVLDMACGSGAVATVAVRMAEETGRSDIEHFCLDYSRAAVSDLRGRVPQIRAVASDAGAAPFADGVFDVVASQFGLEYAGPGAFAEAARLTAPGGVLRAVCHLDGGGLHRECLDNLDTIRTVIDCRFLPLAKAAFEALFALDRGQGSLSTAQEAHRALAAATATVRALIEHKGAQAAAGTPARLHRDVTYMYNRRKHYAPREVLDWVDLMSGEMTAYAGRMRAMCEAARDDAAMAEIRNILIAAGLQAGEPEKLRLGSDAEEAAWILEATR